MAKKGRVPGLGTGEEAAERVPSGFAALRHPQGAGCSFAGRAYEPDAEGVVLVPIEAAAHLLAHGFAPIAAAAGDRPMAPSADERRAVAPKGGRG